MKLLPLAGSSILISLVVFAQATHANRQKQVLALYSMRRDAQLAVIGDREMPHILGQSLRHEIDYYSEYLDSARFANPEYEQAFCDYLRLKYQGKRFDLVLAMSDTIVGFVARFRHELFPAAPVAFLMNRAVVPRIPNSTGVIAEVNLSDTVVFAAALQPDLEHVFVVTGADSSDQAYEALARAQLRSLESRFDITYLSGLPTRTLETRLASLPERSMVYYLLVGRDGANEYFHPLEYIDRVAASASAPTYSWSDAAMGHGILGGSLRNQQAAVEAVARAGLRVLHGEPADSMPVASLRLGTTQVDWRQVVRWHIRQSRIPPGTLVRFREPGLWERYQRSVIGGVAVLVVQTLLISALLVQRSIRRRAEVEVRANRAELRASYDRIRALGGRLLQAQEVERARIARELHDDIGQDLVLLTLELDTAVRVDRGAGLASDEAAGDALARALRIAKNVHNLSHRLHPERLRLLGVVAALDGLCREASRPGFTITFEHDHVPSVLPSATVFCLFRIAQEAVENAARHSGACHVAMRLRVHANDLSLSIADDGAGFDVNRVGSAGLGLISMRERAEAIGAMLMIQSRPSLGTHIEITVRDAAVAARDAG